MKGDLMNPFGASSIALVAMSALFWGGWVISVNSPGGEQAFADAFQEFQADVEAENEASLFTEDAMRAIVCSIPGERGRGQKPCLAVAVGGKLFIVDAGSGATDALARKGIPMGRLQAVLLTGADPVQSADLDELWAHAAPARHNLKLPVYGPTESHRVVQGLNAALGVGPGSGLEPWAPAPEPGQNVVVYESDGLTISAFTTVTEAYNGRVGYRFDYRGRSLVIAADGNAEWAEAQLGADVVLHGANGDSSFAQLHAVDEAGEEDAGLFPKLAAVAASAVRADTGMLVLTDLSASPIIEAMQVREAKAQGLTDVVSARLGMVFELPLSSRDVNVRAI
jgi:ribonuclease Z